MIIRFLENGRTLAEMELEGPPFPGDYVSWDGGKSRYLVLDKVWNYGKRRALELPDMWVNVRLFKPLR